jgi:hypothetical protein
MAGLTAKQRHRVTIEFFGPRTKKEIKALMDAVRAAAPREAGIRQERIVESQEDRKPRQPGKKKRGT